RSAVHASLFSSLLPLFLFTQPAPPELYPLPLHDALPIYRIGGVSWVPLPPPNPPRTCRSPKRLTGPLSSAGRTAPSLRSGSATRSEEHTSELQSRENLVCRLLLEKKKEEEDHEQRTHTTQ